MDEPRPRLRELHPYNDSFNAMELATADRRFEQLVERRERLIERSRFGLLALNGASVIGIFSAYDKLNAQAGVNPTAAVVFFAVGMILSVASVYFETHFVGNRTAQMFGHLSALRRMRATLENYYTERSEASFSEQLEEYEARSKRISTKIRLDDTKDGIPTEFAYSPIALLTLNSAGGAWIGGVLALLYEILT